MSPDEIANRPSVLVYVTIGNSDNRLTQSEWAFFVGSVRAAIRRYAWTMHGEWFSEPSSSRQNACWGFQVFIDDSSRLSLKADLRREAKVWNQHEIAWAEAEVEMLLPS